MGRDRQTDGRTNERTDIWITINPRNFVCRGIKTEKGQRGMKIILTGFIFEIIIPPANKVAGVYSDPYVRPFVRSFVRPSVPSQSLIRYSSKTAEQNFMKLSGIVHYMMPYCTSYFKFLSA